MKKLLIATILCVPLLSGCTALKEKTGEYVTEAVQEKIIKDVDQLLENRGLSRKELKEVVDANNDGKLDRAELLQTTKAATRDAVLLEARSLVDAQIAQQKENFVDNGDLHSKLSEFWLWILGLVSAYLTKQIYSAKQDGKRDQRIAVIEKLLNRDLDGDGHIGGAPENDEELDEDDIV